MKIKIRDFGDVLISRPAGQEAFRVLAAYLKPKKNEKIQLDFTDVLVVAPSWLDEFLSELKQKYGTKLVQCLPTKNLTVKASLAIIKKGEKNTVARKKKSL